MVPRSYICFGFLGVCFCFRFQNEYISCSAWERICVSPPTRADQGLSIQKCLKDLKCDLVGTFAEDPI